MRKEIEVKGNKIIVSDDGKIFDSNGKEKSQFENSSGYMYVVFFNKEHKRSNLLVHRLVAKAFLDNPNGYKYVNHKDLNTKNNRLENIEYCSTRYNNLYANKVKRTVKTLVARGRTVKTDVYKNGELLKKFDSIRSACRYTGGNSIKVSIGIKENNGSFEIDGYTYVVLNEAYKGKTKSEYVYTKKNTYKSKKKFYCKECGKEISYGSMYCLKHFKTNARKKLTDLAPHKEEIVETLNKNKGNFTESARELGISRHVLKNRCQKYSLSEYSKDWK